MKVPCNATIFNSIYEINKQLGYVIINVLYANESGVFRKPSLFYSVKRF